MHVANTGEFRIYLLDQYGQLLAQSDAQTLRFPNQLLMRGDELWVADTNQQRLAQLNPQIEGYGAVERSLKLPVSSTHRWPHQMAWDGQHWWVNVGDHNLSNGHITRFDQDAVRLDQLSSTEFTDPLAITWFADSLWLTDYLRPQLLRFDANKRRLADAESSTLNQLQTQSQAQLERWQWLSYLGLGGFIAVLLGGFYAAWKLEREQTRSVLQNAIDSNTAHLVAQPAKALAAGETLWLRNHAAHLQPWLLSGIALLALCLLILASQLLDTNLAWPIKLGFFATCIVVLSVLASGAWLITRLSRQRIGITEQHFLLEQAPERRVILPAEKLSYGPLILASDQVCIVLGNGFWWVFDRQQLRQYLYPRLKQAHKQSPWVLQRTLWRCRHPQALATLWQLTSLMPLIIAGLILQFS